MAFNLRRTFRYYTLRFMRLRGNPKSLAMGTAIGILIGISPTIPFHTVALIGITLLLRVSTVAAFIPAVVICNPLTMIPQYYICWFVGDMILPGRLTWERIKEVLHLITNQSFMDSLNTLSSLSFDAILVMLTGGFVLGIPAAIAGYFYSLRFFIKLNKKRRQKHVLN
jgi:uncharacterized protein (DUF2062 family)